MKCVHTRGPQSKACLPFGGHIAVMDDGRIINCTRLAKVHFIFALEARQFLHRALKGLGAVLSFFP